MATTGNMTDLKARPKRPVKPNHRYDFNDVDDGQAVVVNDVRKAGVNAAIVKRVSKAAIVKKAVTVRGAVKAATVKGPPKAETVKEVPVAVNEASKAAPSKEAPKKEDSQLEILKGQRCSKKEVRSQRRATKKVNLLYKVDFSEIAGDKGFNVIELMTYLRTELKVESVKVELQGYKVAVTSEKFLKKKYLRYVVVNFLKKKTKINNFVHILADAIDDQAYKLEYYKMDN